MGLDFEICEKAAMLGTTRSWWDVCNSTQRKAAGKDVDPMFMLNEITRYSNGKANQRVIKNWVDNSAKIVGQRICRHRMGQVRATHAGSTSFQTSVLAQTWRPTSMLPIRFARIIALDNLGPIIEMIPAFVPKACEPYNLIR